MVIQEKTRAQNIPIGGMCKGEKIFLVCGHRERVDHLCHHPVYHPNHIVSAAGTPLRLHPNWGWHI